MKKAGILCVTVALALSGMAAFGGVDYITYNSDIKPILEEHCTTCHDFAKTYSDLLSATSTYTSDGVPIVDPGAPDNSVLVWRLEGETNEGSVVTQMPRSNPPLPDETILLVRNWVGQGAYEDAPVAVEDNRSTWAAIKLKFRR